SADGAHDRTAGHVRPVADGALESGRRRGAEAAGGCGDRRPRLSDDPDAGRFAGALPPLPSEVRESNTRTAANRKCGTSGRRDRVSPSHIRNKLRSHLLAQVAVGMGLLLITGCTPQDQQAITDSLQQAATSALQQAVTFGLDFDRGALAAYLF